MDSEIIVQNIQKYCKRSGIKVTPACRNSGAGPNLLQDLKGGKDISLKRIKMLAEYLNITTSELLGEKMPASENEGGPDSEGDPLRSTLLRNFDQLNQEGRERLVETSDDMVSSGKYIKTGTDGMGKKA